MTSRSEELRRAHRRVMAWGLTAAVAAHVAVFALTPAFRAEPLTGEGERLEDVGPIFEDPTFADVLFGPPEITAPDGSARTEPPDRVLEAYEAIALPRGCEGLAADGRTPLSGRIRLHVRASGRVDVLGWVERTGDTCGDQVLASIASALWYQWLPDERYPAPVRLTQPITLVEADR